LETLQSELRTRLIQNPQVSLSIRADTDVPIGQVIKVMDIAKAASLKSVNFYVKPAGQP